MGGDVAGPGGAPLDLSQLLAGFHRDDGVAIDTTLDGSGRITRLDRDGMEVDAGLDVPFSSDIDLDIRVHRHDNEADVFDVSIGNRSYLVRAHANSATDVTFDVIDDGDRKPTGERISFRTKDGRLDIATHGIHIETPLVTVSDPSVTITAQHPEYEGLAVGTRFGELEVWGSNEDLVITSQHGMHATQAEAEAEAQRIAAAAGEDAVVIRHQRPDGSVFFRVYGVTEIRDQFGGGWSDNTLADLRSDVVRVYMTDPVDDVTVRRANSGP